MCHITTGHSVRFNGSSSIKGSLADIVLYHIDRWLLGWEMKKLGEMEMEVSF